MYDRYYTDYRNLKGYRKNGHASYLQGKEEGLEYRGERDCSLNAPPFFF